MEPTSTLEKLQDNLQRQLGWRRKEIASIYLNAQSAIGDAKITMVRAGILLCYAHLEGFARDSIRLYYLYICAQNLRYSELSANLIAVKLSQIVAESSKRASYYHAGANLLTNDSQSLAALPTVNIIISSKSNLNFERLQEMLYCVNVHIDNLELKRNFLDEVLLDRRNAIAHGEFRDTDMNDLDEIHAGVNELIVSLQDSIIGSAESRSYARV